MDKSNNEDSSDPVRKWTLGIVGGCYSHQKGMLPKKLYHQVLVRRFREETGERAVVRINRPTGKPYVERIAEILEQDVDVILLHIRPVILVPRSKLLLRDEKTGRPTLNPRLFGIAAGHEHYGEMGNEDNDAVDYDQPLPPSPREEKNLRLGLALGVCRRVAQEQLITIRAALAKAQQAGVPLIVMGPSPYDREQLGREVCRRVSQYLSQAAQREGFLFVDMYAALPENIDPLMMGDRIHLTPEGHAYFAESILPKLRAAIRESSRVSAGNAAA